MCLTCFDPGSSSSSDSDEISLSDDDENDGPDIPACTPLAAFLSFKQEAEKRRASQVQLEATGKVPHRVQEQRIYPNRGIRFLTQPCGAYVHVFVCVCSVVRIPSGGSDVPLADFSGAVLPFPAAAAAG